MDTKSLIIALVVLMAGFGAGYFARGSSTPSMGTHLMPSGTMMGDHDMGGMGSAMDDMMVGLRGKTGDDFDKAFLSEMIMHHEGAVEMAEAALRSAKHDEIKAMANAIIAAQTAEITQMQDWQEAWYGR